MSLQYLHDLQHRQMLDREQAVVNRMKAIFGEKMEDAKEESKVIKTPGDHLLADLKSAGAGQIMLARDTGLSGKTINCIVKGRVGISAEVAVLLEQYLPPHRSAEYWLELDYKWRLAKVRQTQD